MTSLMQRLRQRLYKVNLTQRLVLSLVLVVIITVVLSTLPANYILWRQLENQVWQSVENGQAATQALYEDELTRLMKLSGLLAERPTLYRLMLENDLTSLRPYLEILKEGSEVDSLLVVTEDWQLGDSGIELIDPKAFLEGNEPYHADFIYLTDPARFYVIAVSQIPPQAEEQPVLGWMVVAREMSSEKMSELAEQTGLAQSLIVDGQRIATSLGDMPDVALDPQAAARVIDSRLPATAQGRTENERYYTGLIPLQNDQGQVLALSEVALPGDAIRNGMVKAIAFSTGVSMLVILLGTLILIRLTRTITQPLEKLSKAAEQASLGNLEPIVLPASDIPEINHLTRQLERARRQLQQTLSVTRSEMKHTQRLLSLVREGVVAIDEDGRISFINSDAEDILGYRAASVLSLHYSHIFAHSAEEALSVGTLLQKTDREPVTQRVKVLDANKRPLLLSITASTTEKDQPDNLGAEKVLVFRDVTEEEAVNRLRYDFLANVAHEFRTPLAGIAATTELLSEANSDLTGEELTGLIETISLSTLHLQTLVDNLLESTTIEAGVFQVHRRPIEFHTIVENVSEIMKPLFKRRQQTLTVADTDEPITVWADSNRMTQVLVNLLSNASKFSSMGGEIVLSIVKDERELTVAVLDRGPGLPAGRYSDLFNRFVTGTQPGEMQYGIGLGLSVVKSIVEMHGGQVGAQNRPTGGAHVWFTVPALPPEESEKND